MTPFIPHGLSRTAVLFCCLITFFACGGKEFTPVHGPGETCLPVPEPVYCEAYRPWFHFTPEKNWMNDPNGLVYDRGEYHLFYQHQPEIPFFGPMHWGHAVSRDLVRWEHRPVALYPDPVQGQAYSGSAVIDRNNTSGLCRNLPGEETSCLAFLFTRHGGKDGKEKQCLAVSSDRGRTLELYDANPVLPNQGERDFRDPKIFRHAPTGRWIMVLAAFDRVQFFSSPDLIRWSKLSEFGPAGTEPGVWECPDLFELPVEGLPGETRWVLQVDFNPGVVIGDSGGQYFVGRFDGTRFTTEQTVSRRVDFGADFYASQSWSDTPGGRRVWTAWMNNWRYALFTPTEPWRGAMTVPREVRLAQRGGEIVLLQNPVAELETLRHCLRFRTQDREVSGETDLLDGVDGQALEILAVLDVSRTDRAALRVRVSEDGEEATEIGYDAAETSLYIDRSRAGAFFSKRFSGRHTAPLPLEDGLLALRILVDTSSVEVFADGGRVVMTDLIFPAPESRGLELFSEGGPVLIRSLEIHSLGHIW